MSTDTCTHCGAPDALPALTPDPELAMLSRQDPPAYCAACVAEEEGRQEVEPRRRWYALRANALQRRRSAYPHHRPQQFTDSNKIRRLTCECGNELPCQYEEPPQ